MTVESPSQAVALADAPGRNIPTEVLESLLREHVGNQTATIDEYISTPFDHQGTNDSTSFSRVTFRWSLVYPPTRPNRTTWVIKHWTAGGVRDSAMGIAQSREVLAWERDWLRGSALPPGITVPLIGVHRSSDGTEAWLAMEDVSDKLAAYRRLSLSGEEAVARTTAILARLAQFHAHWERSERQAELQMCGWLPRPEHSLWDLAATSAQALGRTPLADIPAGASAPPAGDDLAANLHAFLAARPTDEARLWERLLIDRREVVQGLAAFPHTLLHNDLDDRNIGLHLAGGAAGDQARLILIDWEWMALGPAALDVANIIHRLPILVTPGAPIPDMVWGDELADAYFEHYRDAGGSCDPAGWRRAYGLAVVAQGVMQMPFIHGSMLRAINGEVPPPAIVGIPEVVIRESLRANLPTMQRMEQRVVREARRWLG